MAQPNSLLTAVRYRLAQWLDPYPDRGEAWCIGCALNNGKTVVVNAAGHLNHVKQHRNHEPATSVAMRVNWGHIPGEED